MDLGLAERARMVTGASRGIGRAAAQAPAAEGAPVRFPRPDGDALEEAAAGCRRAGAHAGETLAIDVAAAGGGERVAGAWRERLGRIDVLGNNAGTSTATPLEEPTDEESQEQWELSVIAPTRLVRAGAPAMAEAVWGRVVNVCSSSGKRPGQRNVACSAGKAGELPLSRAFADAYARKGVPVHAIAPGPGEHRAWMGPGGLAGQVTSARDTTREEVLEATGAGVPIGRLGDPEEIAMAIVFPASDAASNVNGAAWSVDGGLVVVII